MSPPDRLPNFLFVGADKAGSTWLHAVLAAHPQVCLAPAKDLYYFDRYFDRGPRWYAKNFSAATADHRVVGEVCHDYLYSPLAARRVVETLPDVRIMVSAREPVDRAYSSYLHIRRQGLTDEDFLGALESIPKLIDHGAYWKHLEPYRTALGKDRIYVAAFDDLTADPQLFIDGVTDWLGITRRPLNASDLVPRLEAADARNMTIARVVKRGALLARELRLHRAVGALRTSHLVQRALYQPLRDSKPAPAPEAVERVRAALRDDLARCDEEYGLALAARWGWPT